LRREIVEHIGLLDEGYFLYFEETDFTLRARRDGWECWHLPSARIVHLVGQSSGVLRRGEAPRRMPGYWFDSRRRYFVLNHGVLCAVAVDVATIVGACFARLRSLLQPRVAGIVPYFLRDLIRHSALVRGRRGLGPRRTEW
jgi:GT2 family glycosyltransferase